MNTDFDVIHVHDWMTYPAGILVKQLTGKPLVAHSHALEHDRSGDNINAAIANLERMGMEAADLVVAVSAYTRQEIMEFYGIPGDKIEVIHNAVERSDIDHAYPIPALCKKEKRVLFMGRVTYQKGPDYFVEAARLVLDRLPNTRFIMAGSGDMLPPTWCGAWRSCAWAAAFTSRAFCATGTWDRMYAMSDLYVMPSVSEPFGIAPLEAMACDVPVLVSRQSGVVEVLRNAIKVDFWDVREMANKICALLSYPVLAAEEVRNCREELKNIRWENAAVKAARRLRSAHRPGEDKPCPPYVSIFRCISPIVCAITPFSDIGQSPFYEDEDANCGILLKVARKCYLPMNALLLKLIKRHEGRFKVSFSISGTALDQFEAYAPEVIQSYRELMATGCVEMLSETYTHLFPSSIRRRNFARRCGSTTTASRSCSASGPWSSAIPS